MGYEDFELYLSEITSERLAKVVEGSDTNRADYISQLVRDALKNRTDLDDPEFEVGAVVRVTYGDSKVELLGSVEECKGENMTTIHLTDRSWARAQKAGLPITRTGFWPSNVIEVL